MSTFIISAQGNSVIGFVQNAAVAASVAGENLVVAEAKDLEALSNSQLAELYTIVTGKETKPFKTAKAESTVKVFEALTGVDISTLAQLDAQAATAVDLQAAVVVEAAKVRKVRDSKLQRMAAAFRQQNEDGTYKQWTIKELMETCGKENDPITERIATVYISILRSQTDRFKMPIVKDKDTGAFVFSPEQPAA